MHNEKSMTPFGRKLSEVLIRKNVSDSELAKRLGVAQPNIHTLKYKTERPRAKTVSAIAKALKVRRDALELIEASSGSKIYLVIETGKNRSTVRLA